MNHNLAEAGMATRFKPGESGRWRHVVSRERRELQEAIETTYIAQVAPILDKLVSQALAGDVAASALFLKVMGLGLKPRDDAAIQAAAEAMIRGALEAKRQFEQGQRP